MVDKVGVGCEHPVREPVIAHELPDVLGGVELRAFGGEHHERDVVWRHEAGREVPSGGGTWPRPWRSACARCRRSTGGIMFRTLNSCHKSRTCGCWRSSACPVPSFTTSTAPPMTK